MGASDTLGWTDFAVAMLGAAAVLVGLIFVALSVNMQAILKFPWLVGRAAESILELVIVLMASAFVLVPGQSSTALGLERTALGIAGAGIMIIQRARRTAPIDPQYRRPETTQALLGIVALALFIPAGLSLIAGWGGGLYWLVPAALVSLSIALINSWVLLVEINR